MRRLAWFVAALVAGCGSAAKLDSGPLERIYLPTGIAVLHPSGDPARLIVASSNGDLRFDPATGGAVMTLEPISDTSVVIGGSVNIQSFAGDLVVARNVDPTSPEGQLDPVSACTTTLSAPLALTVTRGSNTLDALAIGPAGELTCDHCGVPLSGPYADPLALAVVCRAGQPPRASAFVGYLRAPVGQGWISEYDLVKGAPIRNILVGNAPVRALAYDPAHDRLYVVGLATAAPTPLRWVELGGCGVDDPAQAGGCSVGEAPAFGPSSGTGAVELRSMALAHPFPGAPQRAFLTGRIYDAAGAVAAHGRTTDFGGVLLVVDLVENGLGGVDVQLVNEVDIGRGAQDVRVLPARPGKRDLVAALTVDSGELWIYDDETEAAARPFGLDPTTGAPLLGHMPYGLAVDPELVGTAARVYVGSFSESFVTPVDVPVDAPDDTHFAGGQPRRITGATP